MKTTYLRKIAILSGVLLGISTLAGCSPSEGEKITPAYDSGKEAGEASDPNPSYGDSTDLTTLFRNIIRVERYSYEVSIVNGDGDTTSTFKQYFTPNAWYVDYGYGSSATFGYAQEKGTGNLFRYYLNEAGDEVYPSVYEYGGYDVLAPIQGLYTSMAISSVSLLEGTMDTLTYMESGRNSFYVTDSESMSVFQYMTTYGSSIAESIVSFEVDIIDLDSMIFETDLSLGSYGHMLGRFEPLTTTPIDFVDEAVEDGLTGVTTYQPVADAIELLAGDNFTMHGIYVSDETGRTDPIYEIFCTKDYFHFTYLPPYSSQYVDFGYALIPEGTTVPVVNEGGDVLVSHQRRDYDACYTFAEDALGGLYFDSFHGPTPNEGLSYLRVDALPETGEANILYIVDEEGTTNVYEWVEQADGTYDYSYYSGWYDSVADFYVYAGSGSTMVSGSFYPSTGGFCDFGGLMMERIDPSDESGTNFYSTNADVLSALASTIFGVGFQSTTTWMNYIDHAFMNVNYEGDEVTSVELGLGVYVNQNGVSTLERISYVFSDFGTTSSPLAEEFLAPYLGGNN